MYPVWTLAETVVTEVKPYDPPASIASAAPPPPRDDVQPLDGERFRLRTTISRRFKDKLEAARDALSHAIPDGSLEAILERGLDLVLAEHARRNGLVEKPRAATRPSKTDAIPANVKRAVHARAGGRCECLLESGERCGSTWQLEYDHVVARACGGRSTIENVRLACRAHNVAAARAVFGDAVLDHYTRAGRSASHAPRRLTPTGTRVGGSG